MSVQALTERDELVVFESTHSQDDMGAWMDAASAVRRTMKCRMHPMSHETMVLHDIPLLSEAYTALFAFDPEMTMHHQAIYDGKVYDVVNVRNRSGQGWLWEVGLRHNPALGLDP